MQALDGESQDWRNKVDGKLDYYLDSTEGRKKLSTMLQTENEAIRKYVTKHRENVRDIIWLSRYCLLCSKYVENNGKTKYGKTKCGKFNARLIKPFYGRPHWETVTTVRGTDEQVIAGIDWDSKRPDVPDESVERAVDKINRGLPYSCYDAKLDV